MDNIENLTDDELIRLYREEQELAGIYDLKQHAEKILLNSLYGSCGTNYFLYYDLAIAEGITLQGQCYIKKSSKEAVDYICNSLGIDYEDMVCAGDTDSVSGDTKILLIRDISLMESQMFGFPEGMKVVAEETIKNIYNNCGGDYISKEKKSKASVKIPVVTNHPFINPPMMTINPPPVSPLRTLSVDENGKLEETEIEYIMKHKVKKRMYTLCVEDRSIKITEDHSIIVERDGELIDITPKQMKEGDEVIYVKAGYERKLVDVN